jgi:hypothetical protein
MWGAATLVALGQKIATMQQLNAQKAKAVCSSMWKFSNMSKEMLF